MSHYDIVIIGGGAGGTAAALSAARTKPGASILLAEKEGLLGGTSVLSGVVCWEIGIASGKLHREIAECLLVSGGGYVVREVHRPSEKSPYGYAEPSGEPYEATLKEAELPNKDWSRFVFDARAMAGTMDQLLAEHPNVTVKKNCAFTGAGTTESKNGKKIIQNVKLNDHDREIVVEGRVFIDCSGNIALARNAGCSFMLGTEGRDVFGEPSADKKTEFLLNGVSLIFNARRKEKPGIDPVPEPYNSIDVSDWIDEKLMNGRVVSYINRCPNGDLNINMLPTMDGAEYYNLSEDTAYKICKARAYRYFQWLQTYKDLANYSIGLFFPKVGVRESYRLDAKYVLSERDIRQPFGKQTRAEEIIAFADHGLDLHGGGGINGLRKRLLFPYGIPYSCLLPKEVDNLIVSCKGSGFSHIAQSSCRLTRTMIALGEAAGIAAALCVKENREPDQIETEYLGKALEIEKTIKEIRKKYKYIDYNYNGIRGKEQEEFFKYLL